MARVFLNRSIRSLHGRIGNTVFRTVRGRTYAYTLPSHRPEPTAGQLAQHKRFAQATTYAKAALADPVKRGLYERAARQRRISMNAAAVGDWFNPPQINEVNLDRYYGFAGDRIGIMATDDIDVAGVHVALRDAATGDLLESGPAMPHGVDWYYTATTTLAAHQSMTIEVTAKDHPGNTTTAEKSYP